MEPWLQSATEYIRSWIEFQLRASRQPGCIVGIAHRGKVVAEYAFGHGPRATGSGSPRNQKASSDEEICVSFHHRLSFGPESLA